MSLWSLIVGDGSSSSSTPDELPMDVAAEDDDVDPAPPVVRMVWIDEHPENDEKLVSLLRKKHSNIEVVQFTEDDAFFAWWSRALYDHMPTVIVTSRTRKGSRKAGPNLCTRVRTSVDRLQKTRLVIYCGEETASLTRLSQRYEDVHIVVDTPDLYELILDTAKYETEKYYRLPAARIGKGSMRLQNRFVGCFMGLAVGDAYGTTNEFSARGSFKPGRKEMVGAGPFNLQPGEWTDDTSMALCMLASIVQRIERAHVSAEQAFDAVDIMSRFYAWWQVGYMSSNGRCFDIGGTTRHALSLWDPACSETSTPYCGSTDTNSAGNGSIMRLAPIPMLLCGSDSQTIMRIARLSSMITHSAPQCVECAALFACLLSQCIRHHQDDKRVLLTSFPCDDFVDPYVQAIARGEYMSKSADEVSGKGWVITTLEAALWSFYTTETFEEGMMRVVDLGEDTDTTGAVYGQIAGAYYGYSAIPFAWRSVIAPAHTRDERTTKVSLYELALKFYSQLFA